MILRTMGQGGMGAVYQARDLKNQSTCAVKEMSLSMVAAEERAQAIQNFRGEATLLSQLHHVNLPAFTGFFIEGSRYFMVMEYIDGYTLEELLERNAGPFPERRVLNWARQLCDVLEYLHSQHPPIIFRDMKPANIMLMRNGRIKLIDFGIARFVRHSSSQDTQLLGTPGYAPPEQYGKAQTDERSDIYSLAMTLFQLMTNTLSENGFGLKDVRSVNPGIAPTVARALEKATALAAEDRYQDIKTFRQALLGIGTFVFEDGGQATTPEELAELCAQFPEEAADYLFAGEIESWLREIGEADLAKAAMQIRTAVSDPQEGIERFLRRVMGPSARTRTSPVIQGASGSQSGIRVSNSVSPAGSRASGARLSRGSVPARSAPAVIVTPRTLDFGQVYQGVSPPLSLSISGNKGAFVRGTIHTNDPWLRIDQAQFDGMSTRVNVRVDSTRLRSASEYNGTILVVPEDSEQEIPVVVTVEVLGFDSTGRVSTLTASRGRSGQSTGGTLDDEDDADIANAGTIVQGGMMMSPPGNAAVGIPLHNAKDDEYKAKYGPPGGNIQQGEHYAGWDPLQATPTQRLWMQRGIIIFAAFMLASVFYTILAHIPPLVKTAIVWPSPWFIVVLAGIIPFATLGALLVSWDLSGKWGDTINRACTGISVALAAVGLSELAWQSIPGLNNPLLQLVALLFVAALAATFGTHPATSTRVINSVTWPMRRMRWFFIVVAVVIGSSMGYLLTTGIPLGWFTLIGILLGAGVAGILLLRVDHLINHP